MRVATRRQIEAVLFGNPLSCNGALKRLVEAGWLDRLDRQVGGSAPGKRGGGGSDEYHYVLGPAGIRLARSMAPSIGRSSKPWPLSDAFVPHALLTTDVYVELAKLQQIGVLRIRAFEVEPACWRSFQGAAKLKPDGFAQVVLEVGGRRHKASFFLEADRGSEHQAVLRSKLDAYDRYCQSRAWAKDPDRLSRCPRILILVPTPDRKVELETYVDELPADVQQYELFQVALHGEAGIAMAKVPGAVTAARAM